MAYCVVAPHRSALLRLDQMLLSILLHPITTAAHLLTYFFSSMHYGLPGLVSSYTIHLQHTWSETSCPVPDISLWRSVYSYVRAQLPHSLTQQQLASRHILHTRTAFDGQLITF